MTLDLSPKYALTRVWFEEAMRPEGRGVRSCGSDANGGR